MVDQNAMKLTWTPEPRSRSLLAASGERRYEIERHMHTKRWTLVCTDNMRPFHGDSVEQCQETAEAWEIKCAMDARLDPAVPK